VFCGGPSNNLGFPFFELHLLVLNHRGLGSVRLIRCLRLSKYNISHLSKLLNNHSFIENPHSAQTNLLCRSSIDHCGHGIFLHRLVNSTLFTPYGSRLFQIYGYSYFENFNVDGFNKISPYVFFKLSFQINS
jgi:hypothetical protein